MDGETRRLERIWSESGTEDDEASLLRARVRSGDLSEERLRLAAHVRHSAACLALGWERDPKRGWVTSKREVTGTVTKECHDAFSSLEHWAQGFVLNEPLTRVTEECSDCRGTGKVRAISQALVLQTANTCMRCGGRKVVETATQASRLLVVRVALAAGESTWREGCGSCDELARCTGEEGFCAGCGMRKEIHDLVRRWLNHPSDLLRTDAASQLAHMELDHGSLWAYELAMLPWDHDMTPQDLLASMLNHLAIGEHLTHVQIKDVVREALVPWLLGRT